MAGNSFGDIFRTSTFGESHGTAIGVVLDGCPAGLHIDAAFIQAELDRRRPGQSHITTQRKESDTVTILSGLFEGRSTGTPIAMLIPNEDQRSKDYAFVEQAYRPSHADLTYDLKYGFRDHRGGGRSSARETAARVAAGAVAKLLLAQERCTVQAYVSRVGHLQVQKPYTELRLEDAEENIVRCADPDLAIQMIDLIDQVRKDGDTIGGLVTCVIKNCPPGLGEPVFDKLHADLAKAMLSINAAQGFEYGSGFAGTFLRGSQNNDPFKKDGEKIRTASNNSGGIQGGLSNGEDIYFTVAFKPVATIMHSQQTVNAAGENIELAGRGRHDPCVLPRAVPIVESMAALVLADHLLRNRSSRV